MSLATRCPACHTAFRVVQDQLKVSSGWVRCGRCSEVFNALEGLFDLERDPSAQAATDAGLQSRRVLDELARHSGHGALDSPNAQTQAEPVSTDSPSALAPVAPSAPALPRDSAFPALSDFSASVMRDSRYAAEADADDDLRADGLPSFIAQADRAARWQRPWVRALMGLGALALLATGALQLAIIQRDWVAAQWPESRSWLMAICEQLDCRIEPLRRIERLAVDSTGLTRIEGAQLYRLSVVLRNRAEVPLLLPAIEVTLNDAQGQLIARRVIRAAEAGATQATIAAGAEQPLQALLSAGERRLAGYTIEIFYP